MDPIAGLDDDDEAGGSPAGSGGDWPVTCATIGRHAETPPRRPDRRTPDRRAATPGSSGSSSARSAGIPDAVPRGPRRGRDRHRRRAEPEQRRENELADDEMLYGLYEGVPRTEYGADWSPLPNRITLFRLPLEEDFADPARARRGGPDHGHPRARPPSRDRRRPARRARPLTVAPTARASRDARRDRAVEVGSAELEIATAANNASMTSATCIGRETRGSTRGAANGLSGSWSGRQAGIGPRQPQEGDDLRPGGQGGDRHDQRADGDDRQREQRSERNEPSPVARSRPRASAIRTRMSTAGPEREPGRWSGTATFTIAITRASDGLRPGQPPRSPDGLAGADRPSRIHGGRRRRTAPTGRRRGRSRRSTATGGRSRAAQGSARGRPAAKSRISADQDVARASRQNRIRDDLRAPAGGRTPGPSHVSAITWTASSWLSIASAMTHAMPIQGAQLRRGSEPRSIAPGARRCPELAASHRAALLDQAAGGQHERSDRPGRRQGQQPDQDRDAAGRRSTPRR